MIYNLVEIANVHAGNFEYLTKLITEFKDVQGVNGIKFQPFKYDQISKSDFAWYEVYKKLYFTPEQWSQAITLASESIEVWIDTFDGYSFEIIEKNLNKIAGLKFQSSILYNKELIQKFKSINLSNKKVLLNISGIELHEIEMVIKNFEKMLSPNEIILQVGFQGYPTAIEDNGYNKINILKKQYEHEISFADHIDCDSDDAIMLPIFAAVNGATYIEKHICLDGEKPKYDFYSSLIKSKYQIYLDRLKTYLSLSNMDYINDKERYYLASTVQVPSLKIKKLAGQNVNVNTDFEFKRTSQKGIRTNEILKLQEEFYILSRDKNAEDCLKQEDFKKANIAVIVACRLKSSRLPKKALLKIGDLTSVELCLKNALQLKNINHCILATSNLEEDAELVNYIYSKNVVFHTGDPFDVIDRYLQIINQLKIDVIVRVTADMPFISNDVLDPILKSHFESGADYSRAKKAAIGTNLEIINAEALRRVKSFFPSADYSEYMTYYFTNNPNHFLINEIDLPSELVRDYRLTLDYPEDLELFNKITTALNDKGEDVNLKNIIKYLDENPDDLKINSGLEVKYHSDPTLIAKLNQHTKISN